MKVDDLTVRLLNPANTIVSSPANTINSIFLLIPAPIFSPEMFRYVSSRISRMAVSLILNSWNGKNTPPIEKSCSEGRISGKGIMLLREWAKT